MNTNNRDQNLDTLIYDLTERAKEFNCLYEIQKLMNNPNTSFDEVCYGIVKLIPPGMQFPEVCRVQLIYGNKIYQVKEFSDTQWLLGTPIKIQKKVVGKIDVYYLEERPISDEGPFLEQERNLVDIIANQLGMFALHQRLRTVFESDNQLTQKPKNEWHQILSLIKKTDVALASRITRKMINCLCLRGIKSAIDLFEGYSNSEELVSECNFPYQVIEPSEMQLSTSEIFGLAEKHLSEDDILASLKTWINEDNSRFMANIFENTGSTLSDLCSAIERYYFLDTQGSILSPLREKTFRVSLIRRLFTDQTSLIDIAKQYIEIKSFHELIHKIISPPGSNGKLGGKSSGLFIAKKILKATEKKHAFMKNIRTPKTWYITSDGMLFFIKQNNLEDTYEQKYKDLGTVRREYPYLMHIFKNSPFPPEIIHQLSTALDDFGKVPLIVRSSSLLEDRMGTAFAGKYKSLFIANQGPKEKRLMTLMDAIAEIYASTFGPDPIEYRSEKRLLDYHEEMGIMIQEVIGKQIGDYYFPIYAGVAFTSNEFRWSRRIKRRDGLIRMVPGLGTRAVDRVNNDYPFLVAPGQPHLKVNTTLEEIIRYSPKQIDLINLKTRKFETREVIDLIRELGQDYPKINQIVSIIKDNLPIIPRAFGVNYQKERVVVSFDGLITNTKFIPQIHIILKELENAYKVPVDIEFAHDGEHLYLLQCRPQSHGTESEPVPLPSRVPHEKILFSANKYISNGFIKDITHIVYVDPAKYGELKSRERMLEVARAIGKLNKILPKRQFILMGPGRWGSKGDIKLGVRVTYSEINQTALLIEIARKRNNYVPDVSFGTHFFLDLVEANIRYLPLYPDDGVIFKETFFLESKNIFADLLPDMKELQDVVRVIDLTRMGKGEILNVYMNADSRKALGILLTHSSETNNEQVPSLPVLSPLPIHSEKVDNHSEWRMQSIQHIASLLDGDLFGVKQVYVIGSTKNGTARPDSDINILIHFSGTKQQKRDLSNWLQGWSLSLSYTNYLKTGVTIKDLLDVHFVTDEDISHKTSFAIKINAITDAAKPLTMGRNLKKEENQVSIKPDISQRNFESHPL